MLITPSGMTTEVSDGQLWNANWPMVVTWYVILSCMTVAGIVMSPAYLEGDGTTSTVEALVTAKCKPSDSKRCAERVVTKRDRLKRSNIFFIITWGVWYIINGYLFVLLANKHTKSADLMLLICNLRPSHCPLNQINNRKPTLVWKHTIPECKHSMDIFIPIGIYCYFGFDLVEKLRSFQAAKHKASINAINMSDAYPRRTIAKHLSQGIYPPA